jgi:Zn-finger nucleic acid-binding protein
MQCPVDNETLVMADRSGVEIDYCPKCRGVWLDRGELDKIIERAAGASPPPPPPQARAESYRAPREQDYPGDNDRYRSDGYGQQRPYKKRESFLGELFDF